jgi:hypothetical protein
MVAVDMYQSVLMAEIVNLIDCRDCKLDLQVNDNINTPEADPFGYTKPI